MTSRDFDRGRPEEYEFDCERSRTGRFRREGEFGHEGEVGWEGAYGRGGRLGWHGHRYEPGYTREGRGRYGYEPGYAWGGYGRYGYEPGYGFEGYPHRGYGYEPGHGWEGRWRYGYEPMYGWEGRRRESFYGGYGRGIGYPQGPYVGRGPKGYQRSDERIREDINDRLTEHPFIDATDIQVNVSNGVVTLQGTVDSRFTKRMAEDVVDSIPGVKDIRNELKIQAMEPERAGEQHRAA